METNVSKFAAFVVSADAGSFTDAAAELRVSQSTVSRMISSLEDEWGLTLFNRHGSYVTLTKDGSLVLPYATQVCKSFKQMNSYIESLQTLDKGTLHIAAPTSVAAKLLPQPLTRFSQDFPNVCIEIYESTYAKTKELLDTDLVEIAFMPEPPKDPSYEATYFESDEYVIIAPVGHFPSSPACLTLTSLMDERFIVDKETAPLLQKQLTRMVQKFDTSSFRSILSMVQAGIGISIMPALAIDQLDPSLEVRHLQEPAHRTIYTVHRRTSELSPTARAFLPYLNTK